MNKLLAVLTIMVMNITLMFAQISQKVTSPNLKVCQNETQRTTLRDSILCQITGASCGSETDRVLNIVSLGARGDGKVDCRPAFERAMRKAAKGKSTTILVPSGIYYIKGPIVLVSNVCIRLEEGATLKFDPAPSLYPLVETSWEGTRLQNYCPMLYGKDVHNVSIVGQGTIDGNAMTTFATWKPQQRPDRDLSRQMNHEGVPTSQRIFGEGHFLRPPLMQFYGCTGVTLEGVKIINSPFWCVHLLDCENVVCRGLRYDAKLINNDGIDPESSRNVLIEDVTFDNGDDNVAIKSGRDNDGWNARPSENIIIRRCHFKGLHAVVIGSEMSGGVRNVFVEDCDWAGYCKRGIYVKTNRDRGGYVRGLYVRNCQFGDVEDLFYVTSMYAGEGKDSPYPSVVEDISVDGLSAKTVSAAAVTVQGTDGQPVRHVFLQGIEVEKATIGMSLDQTEGVTMKDCHIGGRSGVPSLDTKNDHLFDR